MEPTEAAKRKACELANAAGNCDGWKQASISSAWPPMLALASYIDRVNKAVREVWDNPVEVPNCLRSLMLPDEPDPLREICDAAFEETRKLTDNNDGRNKFVAGLRAELAKRGLTIAPKGD